MPNPTELELLESYLAHVGLGQYKEVFQKQGVTSIKLLKNLSAPVGQAVKTQIKEAIEKGDGDAKRSPSPLGAHQVESITAESVQAWIDAQEKSAPKAAAEDPEVKVKQEKINKAIDEVKKLREAAEKEAGAEKEKIQKDIAELLGSAVSRFREEGLGAFPSVKPEADNLALLLKDTEAALQRTSQMTAAAVKKNEMSAVDLIYANQLLRGRFVDAEGLHEAPGGAALAMPKRCTDADLFGPALEALDFGSSYRSESAMMRAERTIEINGSSFATANQASGAAFMGTGIGAMSCSVRYAQTKEERSDAFESISGTSVMEVQTRYHWSPMRQIVFATRQFELSGEALSELRIIALLKDAPAKRLRAKEFMRLFGSHVFGRITLGGWYKYTAKATASSRKDRSTLEKAVATGMDWAVSVSASYVGLGGAGSVSSGNTGSVKNTQVSGHELRCEVDNHEVSITTTILGGTDGLPREEWLGSLQYAPQWREIQRSAPYPIWKVIAQTALSRLGLPNDGTPDIKAADGDAPDNPTLLALAALFEDVWLEDILKASLAPELAKLATTKNIEELERILSDATARDQHPLSWSIEQERMRPCIICSNVVAPVVYDNHLHCFGINPDGSVYRRAWNGSVWTSNKPVALTGVPANYKIHLVQAVPTPDNLPQIVLQGSDGCLFTGFGLDKIDLLPLTTLADRDSPYITLTRFGEGNTLFIFYVTHSCQVACLPFLPPNKLGTPSVIKDAVATVGERIATATFRGRLYLVYPTVGDNAPRLNLTSTEDGKTWAAPVRLPGEWAFGGAALTAFGPPGKDMLYCTYGSENAGAPLHLITSPDGNTWSKPLPLGGAIAESDYRWASFGHLPVFSVFADQTGPKLHCFYWGLDEKPHWRTAAIC